MSEEPHTDDWGDLAARSERPISRLGGGFMGDRSLLAAGVDLGYESNDFYYAGRAGSLGEVTAAAAVAALVFFEPRRVEQSWHRSAGIEPRRAAAERYARCAEAWADDHYGNDADWQRITDDADRVVASLSIAGAPVFAGWLSSPAGRSARARAQHRLNALREYRMAVHAAAITVAGMTFGDAVRFAAPQHVELFGWSPDYDADPHDVATLWHDAEATTNRLMGRALSVLGDGAVDFVVRCESASSSVFPV